MKKASGFEKFFKGKEKTGAAKKEQFRQQKRDARKEREEGIAQRKREKRAQGRDGFSGGPQSFGAKKGTPAFERRDERRPFDTTGSKQRFKPTLKDRDDKPAFGSGKKQLSSKNQSSFRQEDDKRQNSSQPNNAKRFSTGRNTETRNPKHPNAGHKPQSATHKPPNKNPKPQITIQKDRGSASQPSSPNIQSPVPNSNLSPTDSMPLNKYIAHGGLCSRREAVNFIKGGKVKVNGELILEPGHKVLLSDEVKVAGKRLNPVKDFVYILLNKPKDYITTTDDPQQRKTVLDLLRNAPPVRIYPVGRLDRNTSGVLLLTNDGDLSQRLTHPSNEIKKVYAVTLDKPLTKHHFEDILKGVQLDDGPAAVDVLAFTDAKDQTQLGVELHSGRNRIVRRIFEHFGYDVKALDRVVFAGLTKKNVNRGKWRLLTEKEVRDLKFFKRGRV